MKKISLLFCLIILQAGLLCGCRLPHKSSPQKPVEGENKSGLVKVQDDKKEEKKEEKEKEKEEPGKTEIVETEDMELSLLKKQINQNSCGAGVALFGYVDSEFTRTDLSFYFILPGISSFNKRVSVFVRSSLLHGGWAGAVCHRSAK